VSTRKKPEKRKPRAWKGWVWELPGGVVVGDAYGLPFVYSGKTGWDNAAGNKIHGHPVRVEIREVTP
jgi:hypothetical protein